MFYHNYRPPATGAAVVVSEERHVLQQYCKN